MNNIQPQEELYEDHPNLNVRKETKKAPENCVLLDSLQPHMPSDPNYYSNRRNESDSFSMIIQDLVPADSLLPYPNIKSKSFKNFVPYYLEDSDYLKSADSFLASNSSQEIKKTDEVNIPVIQVITKDGNSNEDESLKLPKGKKRVWNVDDDKELLELAVRYKHDWKKVAKRLSLTRKIPKKLPFLRNRYQKIKEVNPNIGAKYSYEEDTKLLSCIEEYGFDWQRISKEFLNRDACSVRNRYYYFLRDKASNEKNSNEINQQTTNCRENDIDLVSKKECNHETNNQKTIDKSRESNERLGLDELS